MKGGNPCIEKRLVPLGVANTLKKTLKKFFLAKNVKNVRQRRFWPCGAFLRKTNLVLSYPSFLVSMLKNKKYVVKKTTALLKVLLELDAIKDDGTRRKENVPRTNFVLMILSVEHEFKAQKTIAYPTRSPNECILRRSFLAIFL